MLTASELELMARRHVVKDRSALIVSREDRKPAGMIPRQEGESKAQLESYEREEQ